ncbi:MAG: hypothetical protein KDA93_00370 [Planctomycetaceae bacterium]|nr:hypothetical protein [Planctomycetaceae bacterium]
MSDSAPTADSVVLGPPTPPPKKRKSVVMQLYTHNPFYVISAMLMLASVLSVYGEMEIGAINCWIMMGVLAGYTALLAVIGVLIVRWGKVWEDARSILLLLLVLFLAVSISADDLFANMESSSEGWPLSLFGLLFSSIVTELVLWGTRIRFGWRYRIPLHLTYALFYAAPWFVSSSLTLGSRTMIAWRVFLFPIAAAGILLTLLPAVRGGPKAVADNGTPWRWPLYPWIAFGVIVGAVAVRTFALSLSFGPTGPLWVRFPSGRWIMSFDTMWGPYFLIPLVYAALTLFLEAGFVTGKRNLVRRVLTLSPLMLVLALPIGGPVFRRFFNEFTTTLGSPLWLTVCLLIALYAWAWWRGAERAEVGLLASGCLLSVVAPTTTGFFSLSEPHVWPLITVGTIVLILGVSRRSTWMCLASSGLLTFALWLVLPETPLAEQRMQLSAHLFWSAVVVLGFVYRDGWARVLRLVGAAIMPVAGVLAMVAPGVSDIPLNTRLLYLLLLTIVSLLIARRYRSRWYLYAFTALMAVNFYGLATIGFRGTVQALGRTATTAALWSGGTLLTAVLISAHKAGWLPTRLFPHWRNGHGSSVSAAATTPEASPPSS